MLLEGLGGTLTLNGGAIAYYTWFGLSVRYVYWRTNSHERRAAT